MFRGAAALPATLQRDGDLPVQERETGDYDPVIDERKHWEQMAAEDYQRFLLPNGMLNEFKMMWQLRQQFPLHLVVFRQTASHIPSEANVEQVFAISGGLADPNMDTDTLATLTSCGVNAKAFQPTAAAVLDKYYAKFRGSRDEGDAQHE